MNKSIDNNLPSDSSIRFDHPLINHLFECNKKFIFIIINSFDSIWSDYNLEDISRLYLFKQLNRRLKHIRQSLKIMSLNDIELKLKYKRDGSNE